MLPEHASALGAALCIILMPAFAAHGWSRRWMLVIAAAGIAMLPDNAEAPQKRPIAKIAQLPEGDNGACMDH
jgi:hypothetical protein